MDCKSDVVEMERVEFDFRDQNTAVRIADPAAKKLVFSAVPVMGNALYRRNHTRN